MRYFWIYDGMKPKRAKPCGLLSYDEAAREFSIDINPAADAESVPMLFIPFIERGDLSIPPDWSLVWVQERIPPPTSQSIGEILEAHHLDTYDELTLLVNGEGRCGQDEFMVKELSPREIEEAGLLGGADGARPRGDVYEYAVVSIPSPLVQTFKDEVGEALVRARANRGMSQAELAKASGIPRPTISRIERGLANPTLETVAELMAALGVSPVFKLL